MKIMLAALFAAAALAQAVPAPAAQVWEVVKGYSYPKDVAGGPFDTSSECSRFMSANGLSYPYHCESITI